MRCSHCNMVHDRREPCSEKHKLMAELCVSSFDTKAKVDDSFVSFKLVDSDVEAIADAIYKRLMSKVCNPHE